MNTSERKRALVTGASSGIGEAYARRLAAAGCDLSLVARRGDRLQSVKDDLERAHGVTVQIVAADLSTEEGITAAERVATERPVDWLVGSAGFATRGHLAEVQPDKIARQVRLHVEANARLVRAALPSMIAQRRGSIVLLSSLSAFLTTAHYVSYSASKAYLNMLVEGLRQELHGSGVVVQALCPGLTRTEFVETEEYRDFKFDGVPEWVWMTAEQVVDESMRALTRKSPAPVFVPGRRNRLFVAAMETPIVGAAIRSALARLGRGKNLY